MAQAWLATTSDWFRDGLMAQDIPMGLSSDTSVVAVGTLLLLLLFNEVSRSIKM